MRFPAAFVIALTVLAGFQPMPSKAEPAPPAASAWEPSTLSEAAQQKILAKVRDYQTCVNDETRKHLNDPGDSRRTSDLILGNCEDTLAKVKAALQAEQVPEPNANLYVRAKRSRAAQQVLRTVMATQAQRSAGQAP
jgi:hypothetical protein